MSKKAVACIHDSVTSVVASYSELPQFHFNEALCKPFENLLCLELCDGDVQDQVTITRSAASATVSFFVFFINLSKTLCRFRLHCCFIFSRVSE